MGQATVRIAQSTRGVLRELADQEDESMQGVLAKAVEAYRRSQFIARVNAGYSELKKDRQAWAGHQKERARLDQTLGDGLVREKWAKGRSVGKRAAKKGGRRGR